jgi:hypothetical protein
MKIKTRITMPHNARREHYAPLKQVATLSTVARVWKRDKKTVRYAIDAANIAAIQDGRIWIVSVPSVMAWWGAPP